MAYITKNDIVAGAVILRTFFSRIIDSLDGTTATDISITGELQLPPNKLRIGGTGGATGTLLTASATELNGLAGRTAGTVTASKPIVAGASRDLDYLRITNLSVANLLMDLPSNPIGSALYLHANFK